MPVVLMLNNASSIGGEVGISAYPLDVCLGCGEASDVAQARSRLLQSSCALVMIPSFREMVAKEKCARQLKRTQGISKAGHVKGVATLNLSERSKLQRQ